MAYDDQNIFAKILRGELPCTEVFEDEFTLAFLDIMPQVKGHTLVLPKTPGRQYNGRISWPGAIYRAPPIAPIILPTRGSGVPYLIILTASGNLLHTSKASSMSIRLSKRTEPANWGAGI